MLSNLLQISIASEKFNLSWYIPFANDDPPSLEKIIDSFISIFGDNCLENIIKYAIKNDSVLKIIMSDEEGDICPIDFYQEIFTEEKEDKDQLFLRFSERLSVCLDEFFYYKRLRYAEEN